MHLTIFANSRLVFGKSSRNDLIENVQVKCTPRLKSPAAEKNTSGKSPARPERGQLDGNESRVQAQAIDKALDEKFSFY